MTVISTPRAACLALVTAIVGIAASVTASAQIGSGTWTPYTDSGVKIQWQTNGSYSTHTLKVDRTASDGVYDYTSSTNVEKFILKGSNVNRIEYRGKSYTSGIYQFEGWLRVNDASTDHVAVAQCFHAVLLKWYSNDGGRLRYHSASDFSGTPAELGRDIIKGARGQWIRVNMIHDASRNRITVIINNNINNPVVKDYPTGDTGTFYFKYGAYDSAGSDDETIEWRDVKVFKKS
jgi:hypothetical protein